MGRQPAILRILTIVSACWALILSTAPLAAQDTLRVALDEQALAWTDSVAMPRTETPGEVVELQGEAVEVKVPDSVFTPDSHRALWFAALVPGLGQLYNRRYWKLPIVAGGITGVAYAISWNQKYYDAYTLGYRDLIDNDPTTNYYKEVLPPDYNYSESQLVTLFKNRQQTFRRQRDLSIIVGVAFYLLCLLDAYVDAELFHFDIGDDLSLDVKQPQPPLTPPTWQWADSGGKTGLSLSFSF